MPPQTILVTGNMGYVGPGVVRRLRSVWPDATLLGYDSGFFAGCVLDPRSSPERFLDRQLFGDVRDLSSEVLAGVDAVVHLAAISNDPMGAAFEEVTAEINHRATVAVAQKAKSAGVGRFVFASSCSVYGLAETAPRTESSDVAPLSAYARSKVASEHDLVALADDGFLVSCLRFSTACGMSPRLRLDLVLNDFVASAIATGAIVILSDGTPWRPLIDVHDMARAIEWALVRGADAGGEHCVVNVGAQAHNFRVVELAEAVQSLMDGVDVQVGKDAQPDKRSYKVDFSLYEELAPEHQPTHSLARTITDLIAGLRAADFADKNFRASYYMRLKHLQALRQAGELGAALRWKSA